MLLARRERTLLTVLTVVIIVTVATILWISFRTQAKSDVLANKRVRVIDAGGHIEPDLEEKVAKNKNRISTFHIERYNPIIQAAEVNPADWNQIASDIASSYTHYDAFVVVHGPDTLAYTSSALAFILENLGKPVIITQGPLFPSLLAASTTIIPEVMVHSRGNLYRGCCASPVTGGFTSFRTNPLNIRNCVGKPSIPLTPKPLNPRVKVVVIKVFPGINAGFMEQMGYDKKAPNGIVLETYDTGRSTTDPSFLDALTRLARQGVTIVGVSQSHGATPPFSMDDRLVAAGVLDGEDMTTEAAVCKLNFLLTYEKDRRVIGHMMSKPMRGEVSDR
jgi:L-asparaginase